MYAAAPSISPGPNRVPDLVTRLSHGGAGEAIKVRRRGISQARELEILSVCLKRTRAAHALARVMYSRAVAAERARRELAAMPRYRRLTTAMPRRTEF